MGSLRGRSSFGDGAGSGAILQRIRTAEDAARYLSSLVDRERMGDAHPGRRRLGLGAIRALLSAVGNPERELSIIHVAGSKGKGSVCLAADAVLSALGERVGVFTSPHLERWTERFRIAGLEVSGRALAEVVAALQPHIERLRGEQPEESPSFFDATTAAALMLFASAGVDRVLLEVGLGGRLDSTNAVSPRVTCITQIELEHSEILGDTLAEIAGEKAGILKPGVPCVMGVLEPSADAAVVARASRVGAPLVREGVDFTLETEPAALGHDACRLRYREPAGLSLEVDVPLAAAPLVRNAGLAVACVRALGEHQDPDCARAARSGLATLRLPGRVEVAAREPWVVIDSAHTAASAQALAAALDALGLRQVELVLSVSRNKSLHEILAPLLARAVSVTVTEADPLRSLPAAELGRAVAEHAPGLPLRVEPDPLPAVARALEQCGSGGAVVVAGSVYLAGIARSRFRDTSDPPDMRS